VRSNYLWDEANHFYEKSMKLWEGLSQDLNYNVMFSQRGVMNLGHTLQDMRDIERRGQREPPERRRCRRLAGRRSRPWSRSSI
jgi:glycine/D-amino acid oxidase-like deaminating enzyme